MGFVTTINPSSGREVYACEVSEDGCTTINCTAHHCPFGWCQRYYVCKSCWKLPKVKQMFSRQSHVEQGCKKYADMSKKGINPIEAGDIKFKDASSGKVGTLGELLSN